LRTEPEPTRMQSRKLVISTALLLLACIGLALWGYHESTRAAAVERQQAKIKSLTDQLFAAKTELEEAHRNLDALVNGRLPGLLPFRIDEPIAVDIPFVRELSFKPATPPASGYVCKLVIENDSSAPIQPVISVAVFDEVGTRLARARLVDARQEPLRVGEIRSFFANILTADGIVPRHFRLTSD